MSEIEDLTLGKILDKSYNYCLSLVHPGTKQIISRLPEAIVTYKPALKDIDEIDFVIPYYINNIINPNFNRIKPNYLILLEKKVNNTTIKSEYYIINKIVSSDNSTLFKQVSCYSYEYTFKKKVVRGFKGTRKLYDPNNSFDFNDITKGGIINYILEKKLYNSWTVDYISPTLLNLYRNFDISQSDLLDIIRDCENYFNCIFEFDTFNRTIKIKSYDDIGENKGLIISDTNLLKSISENINTNEVITRLYVYGNDGLSIARINPQGDYIDNFDVFKNLNYMPQSLINKLNQYQQKLEDDSITFQLHLAELSNINNNISFAKSELNEFNNQLDIIKQNIQTCYDTSNNINLVGSAESMYKYNHITYDGESYLISTSDGTIVTGLEGFIRNSYGSPYSINEIAFNDDLSYYVLVNELGYIYYSTDKENWNIFRFSEPVELKSICYGNGKFVTVGKNGTIKVSNTPNSSWSNINLGSEITLNKVIWSSVASLFIAVGDNGKIFTSSTGNTWVDNSLAILDNLYSICENDSMVIVIGQNRRVLTSINGTSWSGSGSTSITLYDVCWDGSQFIIVGSGGNIYTTVDGITLTSRTSGTTKDLYSVCYNGAEIVAVGDNEVSISSTDGVAWSVKYVLGNNYSSWATRKIFKQNQINTKESEINDFENNKIIKQDSIVSIQEDLLYENNFNSYELSILTDFINEERITVSSSNTQELKQFAEEYLTWKSQPIIEFSVDIQDIFSLKEYQYSWHKIKIGDLINLDFSKFNINKYEVRLIGYTHNINDNNLQLIFSNKNIIDDEESYINKILNNMRKSCNDVDIERDIYKDYQNNKLDITNFVYGSTIDTSNKNIITNGNKITQYGIESVTDDDYEIVITKNKIIMVKKDGSEYYTVVSPNGLASSSVNKDRIIIDYNGLHMYNSNNEQHGISMDKSSINQYADFKIKYNGNTTFEIYNGIDNVVMKFFNQSAFSYSIIDQRMYGLGNHDYQLCNITNTVKHLTQAEALAKADWLENQLVDIIEDLPLIPDDLSSESTTEEITDKINAIIRACDGWMLKKSNINVSIPIDNLVAEYKFENNLDDTSGNGYHLSPVGDVLYGNGIKKCVYYQDKFTGAKIESNDLSNIFTGTKPYTISFWMRATQYPDATVYAGYEIIKVSNDAMRDSTVSIIFHKSTNKLLFRREEHFSISNLFSDVEIELNRWYHVVVQYTGSIMNLYLNSELVGSMSSRVSPSRYGKFWFGLADVKAGQPGYFDSLRIYNRVLSYEEIQALFKEFYFKPTRLYKYTSD